MHTFPWHPRTRYAALALAACALPLLTACDGAGAASTTGTTSSTDSKCAHVQNSRQRARCEQGANIWNITVNPAGLEAPAQPGSRSRASTGTRWDAEQAANAKLIVQVGKQRGVPRRGHVVALATAMQESSLRNLGHLGARNDHDSEGLFQQRPSQGWGTPAQVRDPRYATNKFYERLVKVDGWQRMPIWAAAQAVQVSAYPLAYDKWVADAEKLAG